MKRLIAAVFAAATIAFGSWAAVPAAATDYSACNGVWVVVDFGSLGGGVSTRCATSYSTGTAALKSTYGATAPGGFVTKIAGKPSVSDPQKAYWSYWHATRNSNGSYSGWSYSQLGANNYHPTKGNAEGWHYVALSAARSGPGATPPKNPAVSKTASTKPSSSASKTASATPTKATPSASKSTPSATPSASPSEATPLPTATPIPLDGTGSDSSGPLALIITGTVVITGAAGATAWWLWRKDRV